MEFVGDEVIIFQLHSPKIYRVKLTEKYSLTSLSFSNSDQLFFLKLLLRFFFEVNFFKKITRLSLYLGFLNFFLNIPIKINKTLYLVLKKLITKFIF